MNNVKATKPLFNGIHKELFMHTEFCKAGLDFLGATREVHRVPIPDLEEDQFNLEKDFLEMPSHSMPAVHDCNFQGGGL